MYRTIPQSPKKSRRLDCDRHRGVRMSALGHEQTSRNVRVMSVIPLKADIHQRDLHVRLVPRTDMSGSLIVIVSSDA
jgi:hypothetical protein